MKVKREINQEFHEQKIKLPEKMLTVREVAYILGIHPDTVRREWPRWKEEYQIIPTRHGRRRDLRFYPGQIKFLLKTWEVQ